MCNFQGLLFPWVWLLWGRLLDDKAGARCKTRKLHGSSSHTFCTSLCILALEVFKPALVDYCMGHTIILPKSTPYIWDYHLPLFQGTSKNSELPLMTLDVRRPFAKAERSFGGSEDVGRADGAGEPRPLGGSGQRLWPAGLSWPPGTVNIWHGHGKWSLSGGNHPIYPLVNVYITMENHHF